MGVSGRPANCRGHLTTHHTLPASARRTNAPAHHDDPVTASPIAGYGTAPEGQVGADQQRIPLNWGVYGNV